MLIAKKVVANKSWGYVHKQLQLAAFLIVRIYSEHFLSFCHNVIKNDALVY